MPAPLPRSPVLAHASRNVVVTYCSFWGPVDGYLGLLAEAFGHNARAKRHTETALERTVGDGVPTIGARASAALGGHRRSELDGRLLGLGLVRCQHAFSARFDPVHHPRGPSSVPSHGSMITNRDSSCWRRET